jgi:hypothetical protein
MTKSENKISEDKINVLSILETLALKEAELIWQRFSMMLYANTGLFKVNT